MFKPGIIWGHFHVFDDSGETTVQTLLKCSQALIVVNVKILLIVALLLPLLTFGRKKNYNTTGKAIKQRLKQGLTQPLVFACLFNSPVRDHNKHSFWTPPRNITFKIYWVDFMCRRRIFGEVSLTWRMEVCERQKKKKKYPQRLPFHLQSKEADFPHLFLLCMLYSTTLLPAPLPRAFSCTNKAAGVFWLVRLS